ncbi:hypothetical protein FHR83_003179 [Actinoplanes campanulatus]|uniref:HTH luxR-type domain-containing protein n=1 Tax=Actinoplanes campanulatus TaxID=113559 RepID=A0A7W5AGF5_9ACTN|nr:helix-turn-helix transcriptional regulator [Actinoplanes campanulatus]MBB3095509.1 hypothetical protein [Actinoplanes campanulatus]
MSDFRWEQLGETAVRAYAYAAARTDVDRAELSEALGPQGVAAADRTDIERPEPGAAVQARLEPAEPGAADQTRLEPAEPSTTDQARPERLGGGTVTQADTERNEPGAAGQENTEHGETGASGHGAAGAAGYGAAGHGGIERAAPGEALGDVGAAVERLVAAGLLRPSGDGRRLAAVSPEIARRLLLGPVEQAIAELRAQADEARLTLDDLMPAYRAGLPGRAPEHAIELVQGADEVSRTVADLAARCTDEALVCEPGEPWPGLVADELPRRGVRLRMLYRHADRYRPPTAARAGELTALGAEIRSSAPGTARLLIFDRTVAVAPIRSGPDGVVLLREPNLIGCLAEQFERFWIAALPFPDRGAPPLSVSDDIRAQIIRLLVEGEEDKVIARRIGLSLRTCQRHVAEIMAQLGARNRLHAGYLLARQAPST